MKRTRPSPIHRAYFFRGASSGDYMALPGVSYVGTTDCPTDFGGLLRITEKSGNGSMQQ